MSIESVHNPGKGDTLSTSNLAIERIDELLLKGNFLSDEEGEIIREELLHQRDKILK